MSFVKKQLEAAIFQLNRQEVSLLTIAYEPIWAIGTGQTATTNQINEVHAYIRSILTEKFGENGANVSILYGGSVGPESVDGLMTKPDIDGCLVGGASLSGDKFGRIINYQTATIPIMPLEEKTPTTITPSTPTLGRLGRLTNSIKKIFRKV